MITRISDELVNTTKTFAWKKKKNNNDSDDNWQQRKCYKTK